METFIHPPVTTNTPRNKTYFENERQISLESLIEKIKGFNKLTLDSKSAILKMIIQTKMSPKATQKAIHW